MQSLPVEHVGIVSIRTIRLDLSDLQLWQPQTRRACCATPLMSAGLWHMCYLKV